jgi:hypothetical protein
MIDGLDCPDGGGITINHPTWFSKFTDEQVLEMLDFDDRGWASRSTTTTVASVTGFRSRTTKRRMSRNRDSA